MKRTVQVTNVDRNTVSLNGTRLADDHGVSTQPYQSVRATQVQEKTLDWVRGRPLLFLPAYAVVLVVLWLADFPTERLVLALAACAVVTTWWIVAAVRQGSEPPRETDLIPTAALSILLYAFLCALTGGATSPLMPLLLGSPVALFMLFGRGKRTFVAFGLLAVPLLILLALPEAWTQPSVPSPYAEVLMVFSVLYTAVFLLRSALMLVDAYRIAGQSLAQMREELLVGSTRRAQAIESMGAKVAHELKNPLAAIKGLVQLLDRSAVDARSRERLGVVISELGRMESIIGSYLSFSRPLEALKPHRLEVAPVVDEVLAVFEARADAARATLVRKGEATLVADGRRLKESLLNLVSNAIESIEALDRPGVVRVFIETRSDEVRIVVEDNGEGINEEDLSRLGTPFFTRRENGTGLGVVLARAAVVQHGGDMVFESEPGRGTVVTVTLPSAPRGPEHG